MTTTPHLILLLYSLLQVFGEVSESDGPSVKRDADRKECGEKIIWIVHFEAQISHERSKCSFLPTHTFHSSCLKNID
jgi:hypothetical protein